MTSELDVNPNFRNTSFTSSVVRVPDWSRSAFLKSCRSCSLFVDLACSPSTSWFVNARVMRAKRRNFLRNAIHTTERRMFRFSSGNFSRSIVSCFCARKELCGECAYVCKDTSRSARRILHVVLVH